MRGATVCILALALVAGAHLPAVLAEHAPTNKGTLPGTGWVNLAVDDPGDKIQLNVTLESSGFGHDLPLHVGVAFYDEDHTPVWMGQATLPEQGQPTRATIDAGPAGSITYALEGARNYYSITYHVSATWTAGDGTRTEWNLTAGDAATATATTGSDTFLRVNDDIGTAYHNRSTEDTTQLLLAHETIDIEDALIGHLSIGEDAHHHIHARGPQTNQACPCTFFGHDAPAGSYTFAGVLAGHGDDPWLVLSGADAPPPG